MQKLCQITAFRVVLRVAPGAVLGATALFLAACSTTPSGSDGAQAQTERQCTVQQGPTGSRLGNRRVCRDVERESKEEAEDASEE